MAWIKTINEKEAEGKVKELYEGFKKQAGFVPNIISLFSIKPGSMEATANMFKLFMYGPSRLSRAQREAVALVVSVINQCHYWIVHHGEALRRETKDEKLVQSLKEDFRSAALDTPTRALLEYAEKVTREASKMTKKDVDSLRNAGLSDEAILDVTCIASYFNYINRMSDALGVELEK